MQPMEREYSANAVPGSFEALAQQAQLASRS